MPKFQDEVQNFRHRGFQPSDNGPVVMVFGNEPGPLNPDGSVMQLLWDHDVCQTIHVKDHQVDPLG